MVPSAPGSCAAFTLRFSAMSVAARSSSGYRSLATSNTTSTRPSLAPPWWGCRDPPGVGLRARGLGGQRSMTTS
jgi:hypothetical protein